MAWELVQSINKPLQNTGQLATYNVNSVEWDGTDTQTASCDRCTNYITSTIYHLDYTTI